MHAYSYNLSRLGDEIKPLRLRWLPRLRSTNDYAAFLRKRGQLFAPAMVLTGRQTAGRGRGSNTWWSGPGSITVTFVLPVDEQLQPHQLALIAGLAVRNALARITAHDDIQLKWPNDLVYRDRKLAGLLCERVHKADLIGLGLNVNADANTPAILRHRLVCLSEIAGRPLNKTDVLIELTRQLYPMLTRRAGRPFGAILREYDAHHALVGRRLSVFSSHGRKPIRGTCRGLDSTGRLLISSRGTIHRIVAGQVELL